MKKTRKREKTYKSPVKCCKCGSFDRKVNKNEEYQCAKCGRVIL